MRHRFLELVFTALMLAAWRAEALPSAPTVDVVVSSPSADLAAHLPDEVEVGFNVFTRSTGKRVDGASVFPSTRSAQLRLPANIDLLVRGSQVTLSAGRLKACIAEGFLTFVPEARYTWTFEYRPDHTDLTRTVCRSVVARLSDWGEVVASVDLTARVLEDKSR